MEWINGIISGILSGLIVSLFFYLLSGRDLRREAREMKRVTGVLLRALRDEQAEIEWDEHGAPKRLHYRIKAGRGEFNLEGGVATLEHRDKDGNVVE